MDNVGGEEGFKEQALGQHQCFRSEAERRCQSVD